ncbi:thermonuclease family protein [Roseomonas sp. CCTCC AB2023176]|uniref:thermonuclease family protein n=1 Tax=Roseomonas sp. CCTCC AB2023176 TaxID=3342640 RepID=UPI0035DBEEA9
MPRRRIFRPAPSPRRWRGPLALLGLAAGVAFLAGIGGTGSLMGGSPEDQEWTAPASAVRVVDGETLRVGDRVVRLRGVEAPDRGESCRDAAGRSLDCGAGAAEALARLIAGHDVTCRMGGRDRMGRGLGRCMAATVNVNAALVSGGWALASDPDLSSQQGAARAAGSGFWAAGAVPPAAWRGLR